ncbi:MAG: AAA family ATPase [Candidatus Aquilonibacter sp.]
MPQLVGRESELTKLRAAHMNAATACAPRLVIISGPGGVGKSALADAFEEFAAPQSLVIRAAAYPFDRLIPFSLSVRLSNFVELVERATRTQPALIVIDDVHYADEESLEQIGAMMQQLSNRPVLVVLVRDDEVDRALPIEPAATISLRRIDTQTARAMAGKYFPDAPSGVLDAIVANAHGVPYEVVAIASAAARRRTSEADAVDSSSRAAIAKELAALPADQRGVLQMLSLFSEPVEAALLGSPLIDSVYVLHDGDVVHFDHALTSAAIMETIAMKIPLRRRIIGAIERRGLRTIRDRLALAEQALASGDAAFARATLLDLAFAANVEHLTRAVVWASERHLELGEPPDDRFVEFYTNFFAALMEARAFAQAESVAALALSEAQHRKLPHLGALAAQLVQAQWSVERHEAAKASYERYARAFEDPHDLQVLRDAAPWLTRASAG